VALVLGVLGRAPVWAQSPQTAPIDAIAAAEVPMRAEEDERLLRGLDQRLQESTATRRFDQALARHEAAMNALAAQYSDEDLASLTVRRLESLRGHWRLLQQALEETRAALAQAIQVDAATAASLAERRAAWQATRDNAAGLAPALSQRVEQLSAEIAAAENELSTPLRELLRLGRDGSSLAARLQLQVDTVDAAITAQDRALLRIESPPLWRASAENSAAESDPLGVGKSLAIETAFAHDYDAANERLARVLTAIGILLLPLLVGLKRRAERMLTAGETTEWPLRALSHPLAAWLVLVALGVGLYNLQGPTVRQQIILLLAWIPILRLLPPAVRSRLGRWVYVAAAFYFLNAALSLLDGYPLTYRCLLLGLDALMLAALARLLWRSRQSAASNGLPAIVSARSLRWVAAAVVGAALLSNILGNVSLATLLTTALLDTGYAALALYVGATVLAAVFRVLLQWRTISWLSSRHSASLLRAFAGVARTVVLIAWVVFALDAFRIYRPLFDWLAAVLSHNFTLGVLTVSLGSVLAFVVSGWVAFWLAKTVRMLLADDILPSLALPRGVSNSVSTLTYYTLLFLGLMAALAAAGYQVGQLALIFGALSVGIGFGLQDIVKNLIAGIVLMVERPIQPGDIVEVAGMTGTVREIRMRATVVGTFDGADVVVPNGVLIADKLVNWTLSRNSRRIEINVGTGFGTSPQQTIDLLVGIAARTPGIAGTPPPVALLTGLASGTLEFQLRAWTVELADWVAVRSALAVQVRDGLAAAGIEVPLPQRDLHLRSGFGSQ
jgi:small-conductance mechanosensitive channel